jgi:hypothetical protein
LISAADAIITMSKNAQVIQSNLSRMQEASGMDNIKLKTKSALQQHEKESSTSNFFC